MFTAFQNVEQAEAGMELDLLLPVPVDRITVWLDPQVAKRAAFVLMVNKQPVTEPIQIEAFRKKYEIPEIAVNEGDLLSIRLVMGSVERMFFSIAGGYYAEH